MSSFRGLPLRRIAQREVEPGFAAVAIATLALGIGANTAIFTVANALLLRPLPYSQPDRLVLLSGAEFNSGGSWGRLSFPFFKLINDHNRSFPGVAACTFDVFNLTGRGDPEQVTTARASWNLFDILGVQPAVGRTILPKEDRPGGKQVVLLSYGWPGSPRVGLISISSVDCGPASRASRPGPNSRCCIGNTVMKVHVISTRH
jgi:hypothetical protein